MRLGRKSIPGHYSPSRDYTIKIIWTQSVLFKSVGCSGAWPYLICLPLQALLSPALYWIALTTNIFNWNRSESSEEYINSFVILLIFELSIVYYHIQPDIPKMWYSAMLWHDLVSSSQWTMVQYEPCLDTNCAGAAAVHTGSVSVRS